MLTKGKLVSFIAIACILSMSVPAYADVMTGMGDDVQKMFANMSKEIEKLRDTVNDQNRKIQMLERKSDNVQVPQTAPAQAGPISEKDFQDMLKNEIKNYSYFKNLKMGGDFRLRYEGFAQGETDSNSSTADNGNADRNRFRYRLRYGIENGIGDDLTVGFRLASGVLNNRDSDGGGAGARTVYAGDPTSTNQTLGSPGLFSFNTIVIEKAYAKYNPKYFKDLAVGPITIKGVEIGGGKFDNPFLKYSSPMVWDGDVMPEGIYEKINVNLYQNEGNEVNWFGTAMQSPLKEGSSGETDANLFAFQTGLNLIGYTPMMERPVEFNTAFSLYAYDNYASDGNYILDTLTSLARGNTTCVGTAGAGPCIGLEQGNPKIMEFYNELKLTPVLNIPLTVFNDIATNINNGSVSGASAMKDTAIGYGVKAGKLKARGDWETSFAWYSIPPNAVVGAFTDSDFGQGHANNIGTVMKAGYQLTKNTTLNFAWFNVTPYDSNIATAGDQRTNRFQTDLVWKF